ncbi:hypothetical protein DK849_02020 [Metamycoplasma cloacale]|uniref:Uncharacterized protein n=2 Tax=Metamycoplasma cloacale TaxID=92401 RepID=A0A2Z4LNS8_9BACT|nr:hypothetical protein DK849_02020 [Metamycoplasma cloacale]
MEQAKYVFNMNLNEKRKFILNFCKFYKIENLNKIDKSKDYLEIFINSLTKDEQKVFLENFIFNNKDSYWYLNYWSKTTYYKLLHLVVNLFLKYLHAHK